MVEAPLDGGDEWLLQEDRRRGDEELVGKDRDWEGLLWRSRVGDSHELAASGESASARALPAFLRADRLLPSPSSASASQSFNLTCMPFNLPIPRVFIRHLPTGSSHQPSNSSSSSSTTIAESHLVPVSASPPSFTPPPINEIELEQNVALPPSFHTHAANLFPILNDKVTVRSVVHGSNLSIRSPMAHPAVFEFLANATKCVATRGAVMARVLLKEVLDESWAKSSSWGEKEGWEWVNDLGGPGVLAGVEENHNWRSAIANMSSGGGVFRDDKQRERVVMWNQCWEAVRTARNEAMIAEDQVRLLFSRTFFLSQISS